MPPGAAPEGWGDRALASIDDNRRAATAGVHTTGTMQGPHDAPVAHASPWRAWAIASRPHTLTIAVNPVLVGSAMAWAETGRIDLLWMLLALLGAVLLQLGTNLDNDVSDFERSTDRA